jgi:orotate phosphoribosyltransferase
MEWLFYGAGVSGTHEGLSLMTSAILEQLEAFSSRRIATYGVSAVPLLGACVAAGGGRYSGLVIRPERKPYGAGRQIDGPPDAGSVVLIDDVLNSGTAVRKGIAALEADGQAVEGFVALVDFDTGTAEALAAAGYRVATVFDVWRDLGASPPSAPDPRWEPAGWSDRLPGAPSPAEAARCVAEIYCSTGLTPLPPARLDKDYDCSGGVAVSIYRRTGGRRLRTGWVSPHTVARVDNAAEAIVRAAYIAIKATDAAAIDDLAELTFEVSCLGGGHPIRPAEIDTRSWALAVESSDNLRRRGVALPDTAGSPDETEHLRRASSPLRRAQKRTLTAHPVQRSTERGQRRPANSVTSRDTAWRNHDSWAQYLAGLISPALAANGTDDRRGSTPPPWAADTAGAAISIHTGRVLGWAIRFGENPCATVTEALHAALADHRYTDEVSAADIADADIVVSLLHQPRALQATTDRDLDATFSIGRDTLTARSQTTSGVMPGYFASQQSMTKRAYTDKVRQDGDVRGPATWTAYETTSWVVANGRAKRSDYGFPVRDRFNAADIADCRRLAAEIADYVLRVRTPDGIPAYWFRAATGRDSGLSAGSATRTLVAAAGLLEAGPVIGERVQSAAEDIVNQFTCDEVPCVPRANLHWHAATSGHLLRCIGALTLTPERRRAAAALVRRSVELVRADGAIFASGTQRLASDLDVLSGVIVTGLNAIAPTMPEALDGVDLTAVLSFYRRRFALVHPWEMVWWHAQAWLTSSLPGAVDFGYELVDWALDRQSIRSGAFIIDTVAPYRNSFLTGCVLEAIATSWRVALQTGDQTRSETYAAAWRNGMAFLERLVIRTGDERLITGGQRALGGVRATLASSDVRIDYAGHALIALGKGLHAMNRPTHPVRPLDRTHDAEKAKS